MSSFRTPAAALLPGLVLGAGTAHAAPAPITGLAPGPDFAPVHGFTPGPFAADGRGRVFVLAQDATGGWTHYDDAGSPADATWGFPPLLRDDDAGGAPDAR